MTVTIIILIFLILTLIVGLLPALGGSKVGKKLAVDEYFLGQRGLGVILIFFTLTATWYSSSAFLGSVAEVYSKGLEWIFGFTSSAISGLVFLFLGPKVKEIGDRRKYVTPADMYSDRYKSSLVGYLSSAIGIIFIIPYAMIQMTGTGYIMETFTNGQIPYWLGALIGLAIVAAFIYAGGIRSVAWTDVFFGVVFLVSIWGVIFLIAQKGFGGLPEVFSKTIDTVPDLLTLPGPENVQWTYFLSQAWVIGLGGYMWPHLFMRMFATESAKSIRKSGALVVLASLIAQVPIVIGAVAAANLLPNLDVPDVALLVLVKKYAPVWLIGLLGAGGIAASLSTVNSLIHSESVLITKDIYSKVARKKPDNKTILKVSRICVLLICVLIYALSLTKPEFLWTIMAQAYAGVCQFFPLTIATLFWKKSTKQGVITGLSVGVVVSLFFTFVIENPFGITAPLWGMVANTICLIIVSLLTQSHRNKQISAEFYQNVTKENVGA